MKRATRNGAGLGSFRARTKNGENEGMKDVFPSDEFWKGLNRN